MTSERGANTPETPGSGQDLANLSGRFVALLIDWIACLVLSYGIAWTTGATVEVAGVNQVPAGLFLLYYSIALATGTQTIGMYLMRIACVSAADGGRLVPWRSILRALLLSLVLPALTALAHPYHRGLHDLAAGSVMLKVPPRAKP
ncbi:RDD family protein [Glycomyces paridis]|uniref:RDD family protein n=1 Tax=Glycomyces paridis TaxID=2126555 RepID=A0A4S8PKD2_9ACTN|nr:RDD family protein [Glycomyces paridis]THV31207.1 RDD family protein [Glycomyces paridis]